MEVNLVAGNFHILLGETHEGHGTHHHHWENSTRGVMFNVSHYVHHLSFGKELPGIHNAMVFSGFM
jgi:hypothetical protein